MIGREVLAEVWAVIADPQHWTTRASYRDADNEPVYDYRDATRFCSLGAADKVVSQYPEPTFSSLANTIPDALNRAARYLGYADAIDLNDHTDHDTVQRMFALAVALLEADL